MHGRSVFDDINEGRPVRVRPLALAANRPFPSVYAAVAKGEIKSIRIGRSIRIPALEAARLLGIEAAA